MMLQICGASLHNVMPIPPCLIKHGRHCIDKVSQALHSGIKTRKARARSLFRLLLPRMCYLMYANSINLQRNADNCCMPPAAVVKRCKVPC